MSMTLEEAILHTEEAASNYEGMIEDYWLDSEKLAKCANEQRQIAEWLKELAERRKLPEIVHCGECRFREIRVNNGCCDHITGEEIMVWKDEYCSWAERRTDGYD